ncbi:unnamed protein product [Lampetra fluviatilis]
MGHCRRLSPGLGGKNRTLAEVRVKFPDVTSGGTVRCSARFPKFSSKASSGTELKELTFSLDNFKSKTHQRATERLHDKHAYTRCERISPRTHGDIDLFDGAAPFQRPHRPRCQVVSTPWHRGEGRPRLR